MIKMVTLIENHDNNPLAMTGEHGFSLYLEAEEKKILFDTGQTDKLLSHARLLEIPLNELDMVVLSHGHYDHSGGLIPLLREVGENTVVYVGKGFFDEKYHLKEDGSYHYIGNPFQKEELFQAAKGGVIMMGSHNLQSAYKVTKGCFLLSAIPASNEWEKLNPSFFRKTSEGYEKDTFQDEQVLVVDTSSGLIAVCGCSHVGIINIITEIQNRMKRPIRGIIGGTHLIGASQERLHWTIEELNKLQIKFLAVSHCTGEKNIQMLRDAFGDRFYMNITGSVMEFED